MIPKSSFFSEVGPLSWVERRADFFFASAFGSHSYKCASEVMDSKMNSGPGASTFDDTRSDGKTFEILSRDQLAVKVVASCKSVKR